MTFLNRRLKIFNDLSDAREALLTAEFTTYVDIINVVNRSDQVIFLNLKIVRLLDTEEPIEAFLLEKVEIKEQRNLDLMTLLSRGVFLEDGDSLIVFSEGYTQIFDCTVFYGELNELNQ